MRGATRWVVNGLVLVATVVVTLAAIEVGLRYVYPQPMGVWHQDRDGLALHWPGLATYLPQFGLSVSFNSAGMRDGEHAVAKADGVFRVLVLGDSFMEALQVPFEESFPSQLQRELGRASGRRIEVINASVSGWGTDDELKYLRSYGRRWKPDLVVVGVTLYNDVSDNLRERFHTMRNGALIERPDSRATALEYKLTELKGFLATHFHIYQVLIRARRARETRVEAQQLRSHIGGLFGDGTGEPMTRGLELTRLMLERIQTIAAEDGGRVAVVLIPIRAQLSDSLFAEFARIREASTAGPELDLPQRHIKRLTQRSGMAVVDLLPGFREWTARGGDSLYLVQDGHWDRAGHRLAARIASAELVRAGLVRP